MTLRPLITALSAMLVLGCGAPSASAPPPAVEAPSPPAASSPQGEEVAARRAFPSHVGDVPLLFGVSYGPFREGQKPGGPDPTDAQILEDLTLMARRWQMIRVYSSRGPTEAILRTLKEHDLPLQVMLGAWIAADDPAANAAEVAAAVRLANAYPEQVLAVSVGNETQVEWSAHRSSRDALIEHIRAVRGAVAQPVSTADDYNFWNKPHSAAVAAEVDFLLLHAYAMWNQQTLEDAVPWTEATVASIARIHPELGIVLGETGWATELNPEGHEVQYIKAPAGEAEQAAFHAAFLAYAKRASLPHFYFEAFDEPWKGSDDPREVEKHWGLYRVDRTPKAALLETTP